jgi:lipase
MVMSMAIILGAMTTATTAILPTPLGRRVKVIEHGTGAPVVFLHSGVGSAGEWKQAFSLWPDGYRLVAIEAYRDGTGPGVAGRRSLDDYADQVDAVAVHVGVPVRLVGFSWGGATAVRVAAVAPELVDSLALVEHFYNGPGAFARWPPPRREAFLAAQKTRGDLWDVLFDDRLLTLDALATLTAPVLLVEGSQTSAVDQAICDVVRRHVPQAQHTLIEGAGHMIPLTHPEPLTRALLTEIER